MIRPYKITDAIITGTALQLIAAAVTCIYVWGSKKKLPGIMKLVLAVSITGLLVIIYGTFIEPLIVVTRYETIDLQDYASEEPFQVILIADLHVGRFFNSDKLDTVVQMINEHKDIEYVLILGDVVNGTSDHLSDLDVLKDIDDDKEVFFIYGNHDYYKDGDHQDEIVDGLREKIEGLDITIIDNDIARLDDKIVLAGIEDLWPKKEDYTMLDQTNADETVILMAHNPDAVVDIANDSNYKSKVDLIVSGHTHGGEMRLPLIGPLSPLPTSDLPDSYDQGLKYYDDIPVYITSGLGNIGVRMRIFNNPEIVILTIN
ncbi:MAG: metallophosphoesterase [Patescibacteria group bacterium]|nr:metallophosphoesterase [Patescibacteria group bacterium]